MNDLKIFESPEFGIIRTIVIDDEPWFVGNDVAKTLGYRDLYSALRHNVDNEDKRLCPVSSTSGTQETTIINESGFTLDDVMQTNIDKLKARYPKGFDTFRANNRAEGDI